MARALLEMNLPHLHRGQLKNLLKISGWWFAINWWSSIKIMYNDSWLQFNYVTDFHREKNNSGKDKCHPWMLLIYIGWNYYTGGLVTHLNFSGEFSMTLRNIYVKQFLWCPKNTGRINDMCYVIYITR